MAIGRSSMLTEEAHGRLNSITSTPVLRRVADRGLCCCDACARCSMTSTWTSLRPTATCWAVAAWFRLQMSCATIKTPPSMIAIVRLCPSTFLEPSTPTKTTTPLPNEEWEQGNGDADDCHHGGGRGGWQPRHRRKLGSASLGTPEICKKSQKVKASG